MENHNFHMLSVISFSNFSKVIEVSQFDMKNCNLFLYHDTNKDTISRFLLNIIKKKKIKIKRCVFISIASFTFLFISFVSFSKIQINWRTVFDACILFFQKVFL